MFSWKHPALEECGTGVNFTLYAWSVLKYSFFSCSHLGNILVLNTLPSHILNNKQDTVWNRKRPRSPLQNQQTRELISAWKSSHKHNNKDLSSIRWLSPGMQVNKRCVNSTRSTSKEEENVIFIVSRYVTVCCCQEGLRWKTSWSYLALCFLPCFSKATWEECSCSRCKFCTRLRAQVTSLLVRWPLSLTEFSPSPSRSCPGSLRHGTVSFATLKWNGAGFKGTGILKTCFIHEGRPFFNR